MSDVEKSISGLVEHEELLEKQHHQHHHHQQQQQQHPQQQQQKRLSATSVNKANTNSCKLPNEAGNRNLSKTQSCNNQSQHLHLHQHQHTAYPHDSSRTSASYLTAKQHNWLSRVAKLLFSTPGLVVMVVVYTVMGAFIFPLLEAPQDISKSALIAKSREECLKELWIITEKLNVLYERNWTMLVHEQLRRFEGTIVAATRHMAAGVTATSGATQGGIGGAEAYGLATETTTTTTAATAATTMALGRYGSNTLMEYSDSTTTRWSFSEALLYSVTVITTIGHGSLTPRTAGGKIATIFYALIGVPLMLMCLSSLGALLAEALQCTYARLCCRWPQYAVDESDDLSRGAAAHAKHSHIQRLRCQQGAMKRTGNSFETDTSHQMIKQQLQHQCELQEHKNGMNCKNCKYDAIIGEANANHGYDYKLCNDATATQASSSSSSSSSAAAATAAAATATPATPAMTTIKLGHKEDCCQLLQNSPGKLSQHLSSCMQLKMSPTTRTGAVNDGGTDTTAVGQQQLQQQQHQQQQYYQQRPDVMLMTTGHKLSTQQPATITTAGRLLLPQSLPVTQTQRFYANATPAVATYHIVSSASANSSPTHHPAIRHYILPPIPPIAPTSSTSATSAQHFMAVPSSMVRFHHQATPQTVLQQQDQQHHSGVNTTSNININPLALPASGSATVYFPIVTPVAGGSHDASESLVKYHTIQMPHKRQHGLTLSQQTDLPDNQGVNADAADIDGSLFPPPPPPAYQTATVHGIRRAKFFSKPLPPEINTLLHERDTSCRYDLAQSFSTFSNTSSAKMTSADEQQLLVIANATRTTNITTPTSVKTKAEMAAAAGVTIAAPLSPASTGALPNNTAANSATNIYKQHESETPLSQHVAQNQMVLLPESAAAATATVDIMEDEEEQEQHRLGDCPHGTPSRVPLLTSSADSTGEKSHTRSFLNATAASFQRHTLSTFQRSSNSAPSQPKSVIINRKGECNLHIPKRRNSSSAAFCYGEQYEDTSEDECPGLEGTNIYKLKHLHRSRPAHTPTDKCPAPADFCDNHSLVSLCDSASQIPQVPIIVVLFILTCYVCLGTVIFALWENWSLIDGAYFCFVTLTTIGYGDFVPWKTFQGPEIQLFACCAYLLLGLVLVAMSFSILETQLIWKCKRLAVRLKLTRE